MTTRWEEINKILDRNGPELLRMFGAILMDPQFLEQLVKKGVMDADAKDTLHDLHDRKERAAQFKAWLKAGAVERFDELCELMKERKAWDILIQLGVPCMTMKEVKLELAGTIGSLAKHFKDLKEQGSSATKVKIAIVDSAVNGKCLPRQTRVRNIDCTDTGLGQHRSSGEDAENKRDYGPEFHGTLCAWIIEQYADIEVISYNVFRRNAYDSASITKAIRDIMNDRSIEIVCMGFGLQSATPEQIDLLKEISNEKVLIAAASEDVTSRPEKISSLAAENEVIAVSSCDNSGDPERYAPQSVHLTFLMPGCKIWDGKKEKLCTTLTAPLLTAAAALTLQFIQKVSTSDPELKMLGDIRKKMGTSLHMENILKQACGHDIVHDDRRGYGMPKLNMIDKELLRDYVKQQFYV